MRRLRYQIGVTLIELLVTLIIAAILLMMTIPAFNDSRQRAALRGAAEQAASFWADARFEALRRNQYISVTMKSDAAGQICLGAEIATSASDMAGCDCFTQANCSVATYPSDQRDWRRIRVPANPTLGAPDMDAIGVAVIDPKRGGLGDPTQAGVFQFQSPAGGNTDYRLNVSVDRNGRAFLCEPVAAPDKLPQYTNRRC